MSERDWSNDWDNPDNPYNTTPTTAPPAPNPPRAADDPYYTQPLQPGVLAPDSGYGWGGVDNPAYINRDAPEAPPPVAPTGGGPAPTVSDPRVAATDNGSVPSSYRAPSTVNAPSASLPADIMALFNKKPEQTPVQAAYQNALLSYMKRSQETPTLDDGILGPQTEVYRAQQQRNTERNRRQSSERAAANGMGQSGYLDQQINLGEQQQGSNTASFNANLLGGEMTKRRDELQAGLQLASATGNQEAERELRTRLAQVNAAMQQQALNLQGQLGFGDLDLRWDQLGANTALTLEQLNQKAVQILGGNP